MDRNKVKLKIKYLKDLAERRARERSPYRIADASDLFEILVEEIVSLEARINHLVEIGL